MNSRPFLMRKYNVYALWYCHYCTSLNLKPASPRDPTRNFVFPEGDSNVVLGDAANALEDRSRAALLGDPVNALEDRSRATVGWRQDALCSTLVLGSLHVASWRPGPKSSSEVAFAEVDKVRAIEEIWILPCLSALAFLLDGWPSLASRQLSNLNNYIYEKTTLSISKTVPSLVKNDYRLGPRAKIRTFSGPILLSLK